MDERRAAKVLICFYSRYGATAKLAEAIASGARMIPPDDVRIRRIPDLDPDEVIRRDESRWRAHQRLSKDYPEVTPEDVAWANGLVVGSPGYLGGMAAAVKAWLEQALAPWNNPQIEEKAGAAFSTTATAHGGSEATIASILTALMHLGLIITPSGYVLPTLGSNQCPYGATFTTGYDHEFLPTEGELAAARSLGFRVSHVARCLIDGRELESYRRRHWYLVAGPSR
ncbi:MAG TPA: NAD(P)H-dependent oxidoreductase [Chloroflexota bacterium]|nr:NAD(P)H-dependent oxidoreductase [Chloroflexota bacterium]